VKLLFLHGPPAVGKLTIAREVARQTGWRLLHNHLVVDLALAIYDFGTPGFIAFREQLWLSTVRRAIADDLPGLIFTFTPEKTVHQYFIDELYSAVTGAGTQIITIQLTASEAEIERRLGSDSRREHRKLVDLELYRKLRDEGAFRAPIIPKAQLRIDTERRTPGEAATTIGAMLACMD
jgi:hypothetical protein